MTVAVGLVGAGCLAQFHAEARARMPGARLAVICDPDRAKAKTTAARYGGAVFGGLAAMLAAAPLDILDIAAPLPAHAPAIRAGDADRAEAIHRRHREGAAGMLVGLLERLGGAGLQRGLDSGHRPWRVAALASLRRTPPWPSCPTPGFAAWPSSTA